ncbi:RagB/SusD family nutrient uptake outer membrane protein [Rufibacter roseus]|uniref:RagB/SusD family nutrient uptake outer membrane protein n=1 Tax=Rufibacter roseus TaxID=1567108 RepID=A0ABW2DQI3_9BACT|nr:RagB/SusD family nutrient uptake outer membrane protein [Rufibacter roseus]
MKAKYILPLITLWLGFTSCNDDFLDRAPNVNLSDDEIFADPLLASRFADNAYNHLIDDYARFNSHRGTTSQASDEAVSGNNDVSVRTLNLGTYHDHYERGGAPLNDIRDVWNRAYSGIRITNVMLSKMNTVPWTGNPAPGRVKGEMHFIRAFLYFELAKRFGGVPIIERAYDVNESIDIPRSSYEEVVNFILADLKEAEVNLPEDYPISDYGRATQGAAMALKSRVLLYAASPLHNPTNNTAKWATAAAAAKAVIDLEKYSLQSTYGNLLNVNQSPEYIMTKVRGPRSRTGYLIDFLMSPGSGGAQGQYNPTQNHVDLYEMRATGKPILESGSGYDPQKPYEGRDPRFYDNILYNDAPWQGRKMEMWDGGRDYRDGNATYTATRYYVKKLWPEVYTSTSTQTALVNFVFFRYAEILLNYAEAQNEAVGPDASVYASINQVRARPSVSMPPLPEGLTKEQMRARIRNERAVELAFEDHRWYDIMRWKVGPEVVAQPMYGMNVVRNANGTFTYNRVLLPQNMQKVYLDYMHLYPIPRSEVYKSNGILQQNPGW